MANLEDTTQDGTSGLLPEGWIPRVSEGSQESALVGAPSSSAAASQSPLVGASNAEAPATSTSASPAILARLNSESRGVRNNNPGNLEANAWTAKLPGYVGSDGRFAKFSSPEAGIVALKQNLSGYASKGISTPLGIASTWAPGSEKGNDPASYGSVIAKALGVQPGDQINLHDPIVQEKVAAAIARVENGVSGGGPAKQGGGNAPSSPEASPATSSPAEILQGEMKLAMLRGMFPQHLISPVEYDPWKYVLDGPAKRTNTNQGMV